MTGTSRSEVVPALLEDERGEAVGSGLEKAASASRSAAPLSWTGASPARTHRIAATSHTTAPSVLRHRPVFMESSLQAYRTVTSYRTTTY